MAKTAFIVVEGRQTQLISQRLVLRESSNVQPLAGVVERSL